MEWIDPVWAVPTIIFGAVGVLVARWRKVPLIEIAMGTGGYFLFIWGLMWASSFDRGAFLAWAGYCARRTRRLISTHMV